MGVILSRSYDRIIKPEKGNKPSKPSDCIYVGWMLGTFWCTKMLHDRVCALTLGIPCYLLSNRLMKNETQGYDVKE